MDFYTHIIIRLWKDLAKKWDSLSIWILPLSELSVNVRNVTNHMPSLLVFKNSESIRVSVHKIIEERLQSNWIF